MENETVLWLSNFWLMQLFISCWLYIALLKAQWSIVLFFYSAVVCSIPFRDLFSLIFPHPSLHHNLTVHLWPTIWLELLPFLSCLWINCFTLFLIFLSFLSHPCWSYWLNVYHSYNFCPGKLTDFSTVYEIIC